MRGKRREWNGQGTGKGKEGGGEEKEGERGEGA